MDSAVREMAQRGLRVLAVAEACWAAEGLPETQRHFDLVYRGLVGLADPIRDTVPDAVEQAVTKALAKLPADRFGTAAQFAEALVTARGALAPLGAVTTPAEPSSASPVRRRRALANWLTGVLALGLLSVGAAVALRTAPGAGLTPRSWRCARPVSRRAAPRCT